VQQTDSAQRKKISLTAFFTSMDIITVKVGILQTNCYLLKQDGQAVIIDPGAKAQRILNALGETKPLAILLTHAHFDHIGAIHELLAVHDVPIYLHPDDEALLHDPQLNYSFPKRFTVETLTQPYPSVLKLGPFIFDVMDTPGHTEGSVMLQIGEHLFSGDTLFHLSIGRTDLKTGNPSHMKQSLRRIKTLHGPLTIWPGHDEPTTLDDELKLNPYLN
jgi:glyoxylase-like metal-dependent hydrolase (beta-lactamase superfamily II)